MLGLLHSEMYETVKEILEIFFSMIEKTEFRPDDGQTYYLTHSQPPMLTSMVKSYMNTLDETDQLKFIAEAMTPLDTEYAFFEKYHAVKVKGHKLFRYGVQQFDKPNSESYREKNLMTKQLETYEKLDAENRDTIESSFDLYSDDGTNNGNLADIIPVELNAMMYFNAKILAQFHLSLNHIDKATSYENKAKDIFEVGVIIYCVEF